MENCIVASFLVIRRIVGEGRGLMTNQFADALLWKAENYERPPPLHPSPCFKWLCRLMSGNHFFVVNSIRIALWVENSCSSDTKRAHQWNTIKGQRRRWRWPNTRAEREPPVASGLVHRLCQRWWPIWLSHILLARKIWHDRTFNGAKLLLPLVQEAQETSNIFFFNLL